MRIEAAPGGVDVEPLDASTRAGGREAARRRVRARAVHGLGGARSPCSASSCRGSRASARRSRPTRSRASSPRSPRSRSRSSRRSRSATRMIERFGVRGRASRSASRPRERLADASEAELVALGFSRRKAEYVRRPRPRRPRPRRARGAAATTRSARGSTAIRGLGPWTAEWFLARHLARPRAWPAGDLGLRKAADTFYGLDVHELGPRLDPFQNLSAHYLLTGLRWHRRVNVRRATRGRRGRAPRALGGVRAPRCPSRRAPRPRPWAEEWAERAARHRRAARSYLAEDDEGVVGIARATAPDRGRSHLDGRLRPAARTPPGRREGAASRRASQEVEGEGRGHAQPRRPHRRTPSPATSGRGSGFEEVALVMATPLEALERRLADGRPATSRASTHVQSDDLLSVERAIAQFVPRLEAPKVTRPSKRLDPDHATRLLDADRDAQARLARELSDRLGAVVVALALEYGERRPLPPLRGRPHGRRVPVRADVLRRARRRATSSRWSANPTLVARLTGADRDEVRRCAHGRPLARRPAARRRAVRGRSRGRWGSSREARTTRPAAPTAPASRIALAEKGDRVRAGRDRPRQPARLGLRAERLAARCRSSTTASCCPSRP